MRETCEMQNEGRQARRQAEIGRLIGRHRAELDEVSRAISEVEAWDSRVLLKSAPEEVLEIVARLRAAEETLKSVKTELAIYLLLETRSTGTAVAGALGLNQSTVSRMAREAAKAREA